MDSQQAKGLQWPKKNKFGKVREWTHGPPWDIPTDKANMGQNIPVRDQSYTSSYDTQPAQQRNSSTYRCF